MDHITAHDPSDYIEYEGPRELTPEEERLAQLGQLRDEASLAKRKAVAIQKLLADLPLSEYTVPDERTLIRWHVQSLLDEAQRTEHRIYELERAVPASTARIHQDVLAKQLYNGRSRRGIIR